MVTSGTPEAMLDRFCGVASTLYPSDPWYRDSAFQLAHRNAMLFAIRDRARVAAFESPLRLNGKQVGIIGYYECEDSLETAQAVLQAAESWLVSKGVQIIIGPMDGSTWHKYRFKEIQGSASPAYFLDNYHKPWYPAQFRAIGFEPLAKYYSTCHPLDAVVLPETRQNLSLREFRPAFAEEDLRIIYQLSMEGFRDNFLFAPIEMEEFLELYRPIISLVDSRFVFIVEDAGRPVGFAFAIPDQMDTSRIIVKSVAVVPEYRSRRIGSLMINTLQARARELGFTGVVHAFMHENNFSRRWDSAKAKTVGEYTLYSKVIG